MQPHVATFTVRVNKNTLERMDFVGRVTGASGDSICHHALNLYSTIIWHIAHKKSFVEFRWGFGNAGSWNLRIGDPPVSRRSRSVKYLWLGLALAVAVGAFLLGRFTS